MSKIKKPLIVVIIIVIIIGLGVVWYLNRPTVYAVDTTLSGDLTIPAGERIGIKNNATLTIDGNFAVEGKIECSKGPISLVVKGALHVSGQLECNRSENISDTDLGNGIIIIVKDGIEFTENAVVATNGHIQIVDDETKIATTNEKLDEIYNDSADDSGEGLRVGPFIPIELAPGQVSYTPKVLKTNTQPTVLNNEMNDSEKTFKDIFIHSAQAQVLARDAFGWPVPNTVKIGGKWIVGDPSTLPPGTLSVNKIPKNIKRIIINYNFGQPKAINIQNFTLFGPDGRPGNDDKGTSCNAKGDKGENAFRLRVIAPNIKINNFTLFLGDGGLGGDAETKEDCDPGIAAGGKGGSPGNFKMIASNKFEITGQFNITPGLGGVGGSAFAHGKDGEAACPGEKGGDAKATGGEGGDNKKGLKVLGTVTGINNITIKDIIGGPGGFATAFGGDGGDGNKCGCNGGEGGEATALGGEGGDATSRTVPSRGGNGGDASAFPGIGGKGGSCGPDKQGGDGGNGGDAKPSEGKGGTGRTERGQDGNVEDELGGPGGNGGDGCQEGSGGEGGQGNPKGDDGDPGKNLCKVKPPEKPIGIMVSPDKLIKIHNKGKNDCPDPYPDLTVSGPAGLPWSIDPSTIPSWLNFSETSGMFLGPSDADTTIERLPPFETEIVSMKLKGTFTCFGYTNKQKANVKFQSGDSSFEVEIELEVK